MIKNVIRGVAYSLNILHHSRFGTQVTEVSSLLTDNRLCKIQSVLLENNISQKQAELNGLEQSVPFKIIIFCFKAFLFLFIWYFVFTWWTFQVRTCVLCVRVATPLVIQSRSKFSTRRLHPINWPFYVQRKTGSMLCRTSPWEWFWALSLLLLAIARLRRKLGQNSSSKTVPQCNATKTIWFQTKRYENV